MNDLVIYFGIICCAILVGVGFYHYFRNMVTLGSGAESGGGAGAGVLKKDLSLSEVRLAPEAAPAGHDSSEEPVFKTLRVYLEKIAEARWRFKIRFVFKNVTEHVITLDDIHTAIYEKYVPAPPYATISYRGEMLLQQDNSILKEGQDYSLRPGEGYEMVLVFEQTRLEGAPLYGGDFETPGAMISICGLFVDYYYFEGSEIVRRAIPSDTVYYFECADKSDRGHLHAVDATFIENLKGRTYHSAPAKSIVERVGAILEKHVAARPSLKP